LKFIENYNLNKSHEKEKKHRMPQFKGILKDNNFIEMLEEHNNVGVKMIDIDEMLLIKMNQ